MKRGLAVFIAMVMVFVVAGIAGYTDAQEPTVGSVDTAGTAHGVYVDDSYAYVADGDSGLQVIDVTNPESPVIVGSVGMRYSGRARGVHVSGSYAYVVNDLGDFQNPVLSLEVIDISNPESPVSVGYFGTQGSPRDLHVSGSYAYVVWESSDATGLHAGLKIIDVSDPQNPAKASYTSTGYGAQGVYINDGYAYVVDGGWTGLQVFNVSDPENPIKVTSVDAPYATKVYVSGGYAYVAGADDLQVFDLSDPENPALVGFVDRPLGAQAVHESSEYAYVAAWENGLQVIDVSNPQRPTFVGSVDIPGQATDVSVSGSHAYVTANESGLRVIDASIPLPDTTPPTVTSITPENNATDVDVNTAIIATFSEAMDSSTITTDSFLVNDSTINIAGTVTTVTQSGTVATFSATTALDYSTTYTATITTGAKDLAGNALEADYTWSFTTESETATDGEPPSDGGSGCFISVM